MNQQQTEHWSPWPHRMAWLLVCATFPLIWVGGLVTTYEAGMAVPDWPSTYGYNLFLYPWQTWLFGPWDIFIEHGHRLLGAAVGFIAIGLVAVTWWFDNRTWMRWLTVAALALVIFQGILGGQRVLQNARQIAQVHGVVGPTFFALAAAILVMTSRFWRKKDGTGRPRQSCFSTVAWLAVVLAWTQLILGSQLRHVGAFTAPALFGWALKLHVATAIGFVVLAVLILAWVVRYRTQLYHVRWPVVIVVLLVMCQVVLGLGAWVLKYGWPMILRPWFQHPQITVQANSMVQSMVVTAHQAVGASILACSVFAALRASRQESRARNATVVVAGVHA